VRDPERFLLATLSRPLELFSLRKGLSSALAGDGDMESTKDDW